MKIYTVQTKQKLPITVEEAWNFLANPANLKIITPDHLGFQILSGADREMYPGQIIQYHVTPIANFKLKWVTQITHVEKHQFFVDEQRYGPYALWHHKHFIKEIPGGVEMEDLVHYKVPLGFLGRLAHPLLVKPRLDEIFSYREKKLYEIYGEYKSKEEAASTTEATLKQDILN